MTVAILGGTRFLGRRVAELLIAAGEEVVVAHRGQTGPSPAGTTPLRLDRASGEGLDELTALRPAAIVDLSGYQAEWTRAALAACRPGVHYVFVSSGAVYRPSPELPWPESTPPGPMPLWRAYGSEKLAAEQALWDAHEAGAVDATVLRLPFVMGPGNYADREAFVCSRILAGRPVLLPGGGTALNQLVHVDDAARALVAAVDQRARSAGAAFNCGYARAVTNAGFVELCAEALGLEADVVPIDEKALGVAAETFDLTDLVFPFPDKHYVLDSRRLEERLGVEAHLDNRRIVSEFVADWRATGEADRGPRRYNREERALAALAGNHVTRRG